MDMNVFILVLLVSCSTLSTSGSGWNGSVKSVSGNCDLMEDVETVECLNLTSALQLPVWHDEFLHVKTIKLVKLSGFVRVRSVQLLFPNVERIQVTHTMGQNIAFFLGWGMNTEESSEENIDSLDILRWDTVQEFSLNYNYQFSEKYIHLRHFKVLFPNLKSLNLANNSIRQLTKNQAEKDWIRSLASIDLSGNPLDCRRDFEWVEQGQKPKLLNADETLCDLPSHQNRAKPIYEVVHLIKKVDRECRLNCSCNVVYIWEQNQEIFSKTEVNCSARGFTEFPNPQLLPKPTDTLDLSKNMIRSMRKFVQSTEYEALDVMNLYLDDNFIKSINILEGSEWFYNFQVFTISRNNLTEVPVYVLENVMKENKRVLRIDLSENPYDCDCRTLSTFKVWLLRYAKAIKNIEGVQCAQTKEQIRYLKTGDWCNSGEEDRLHNALNILSIIFAVLIVVIILKVYYDYWNLKRRGKVPWIVRKI